MKEEIYIIAVNYGTSRLIRTWYQSAQAINKDVKFIIVDNFSTIEERKIVESITNELSITLIKSDNVGYGRALNVAIDLVKRHHTMTDNVTLLCGNLDIEFSNIPTHFPNGSYVFVPKALEGVRDRNPFITNFQRKFLVWHKLSLKLNSLYYFMFVIIILKLAGKVPSKTWAVHGSLFCFNLSCINKLPLFNQNTFLYSEELEFASYMNRDTNIVFVNSDLIYKHEAHCATKNIITTKSDFFAVWKQGFSNWCSRWGI